MGVTKKTRSSDRVAVSLGLLGAALVWLVCPSPIDRDDAKERAAHHLPGPVQSASLSLDGRRWTVCAAASCAVLDGQTGDLLRLDPACPTPQP